MAGNKNILLEKSDPSVLSRKDLKIKIFSDGANLQEMLDAYKKGAVQGFTTNPTLMRKAGVTDYEKFAKEVLAKIQDSHISFEVFADDFSEMERQARKITQWGKNVYVKIPVTNTKGEFTGPLIQKLASDGIALNITAILTVEQVKKVSEVLSSNTASVVSVFAGRIADTGRNPIPIMKESAAILKHLPKCELLWASSREVLNVIQAQECGCQIITVTNEILKKLEMVGKDLTQLSLDTVKMFYEDGQKAGYKI